MNHLRIWTALAVVTLAFPLAGAIEPSATFAGDGNFGRSVAVAQNLVVVGAYGADRVHIQERGADGTWMETILEGASRSRFGWTVATDGSTLVVGAPEEGHGAAYLYERAALGGWNLAHKLDPCSDTNRVGWSADLDGGLVAVGAAGDYASVGNGLPGGVFLLRRDAAGDWDEEEFLSPEGARRSASFGLAVAVSGDTLLVGSPFEGTRNPGAIYLFQRNLAGEWPMAARLAPGMEHDLVGFSVDLDGDFAIVGARGGGEDVNAGAVHMLERGALGDWAIVQEIRPSTPAFQAGFGHSVALDGFTAVVGSPGDPGIRGTRDAGAVYVLQRGADAAWGEIDRLAVESTYGRLLFGQGVAIAGGNVAVGESGRHTAYLYCVGATLAPPGASPPCAAPPLPTLPLP